jgi:hypothetical protein
VWSGLKYNTFALVLFFESWECFHFSFLWLTFKKTHHKNQIDGSNLGTFTHVFGRDQYIQSIVGDILNEQTKSLH